MDSNVDFEENETLELKKSTSDFGIKNDGTVVGQDTSEKIILLIKENPSIIAKEIAEKLGVSSRAIEMQIAKLKKNNIITKIGPAKGGHWAVVGK